MVFRYSNSSGSSYYDTGKGHSFYNRCSTKNFLSIHGSSCSGSQGTQGSGGVPYSTHTNQNQGYSTTKYK